MSGDATRAMDDRPVLFLSYSGVLGGAERVLLDCAVRLGQPALVACPEGPLAAAARGAGLDVVPIRNRSLHLRTARVAAAGRLGGLAVDAARLARRRRPAALVAWSARAVLATAAAPLAGTPWLAVHHDLLPGAAVSAAVRAASRRADGVVATSRAVARELRGPRAAGEPQAAGEPGGGGSEVTILHPGVDLAAWRVLPPADGPPRALVLGALVPWKRPDLALEIAARVPRLELELAGAPLPGDGDELESRLRDRAAQGDLAGRVTFSGALADPRAALASAHLLLHCADAEPFGMALLEALASGRPVAAPAAAGPLEIVADGAGRLYAPGDAATGAAAVQALLDGATSPEAARARAERFPVEASAARLAAAVEAIAR
jgi:glycosyltransferase involved in cell wall biosynthesis